MRLLAIAVLGLGVSSGAIGQASSSSQWPVEATTASGEKVRLFDNGRWEYVEARKAALQRQEADAEAARERSSQGGFLGFGRRIYEGDKEYNRGTLNPKMR